MESRKSKKVFLACSICKGLLFIPRYFECLHSFCTPCLERHSAQKPPDVKMMCPTCNLASKTATEPEHLPLNQMLINLIRTLPSRDLSGLIQKCGMCKAKGLNLEDQRKASLLCQNCKEYLCDKCMEVHDELFRGRKKHHLIGIADRKKPSGGRLSGSSFLFKSLTRKSAQDKERCSLHKKETLKLYCNLCEKVLCVICKVTNHDDHQCMSIDDVIGENKEKVRTAIDTIQPKIQQVTEYKDMWKEHIVNLHQSEHRIKWEIDSYAKELIKRIEEWQQDNVKMIEVMFTKEKSEADMKIEHLQTQGESLEILQNTADELLTKGKNTQLLCMTETIKHRCDALNSLELISPPSDALLFSLQSSISTEQFTTESIGIVKSKGGVKTNMADFKRSQVTEQSMLGPKKISDEMKSTKLSESPREEGLLLEPNIETTETVSSDTEKKHMKSFTTVLTSDTLGCKLTGMSLTKSGSIVVVDNLKSDIKFFNRDGFLERVLNVKEVLETGIERRKVIGCPLWDCAVLAKENLVTASTYGIHVLSNTGDIVVAMDTGSEYTSVVANHSNNRIIAYSNKECRVVTFDINTYTKLSSFVISLKYAIGTIGSVTCDNHGNVVVSDMHTDTVKGYSHLGRKLFELGNHGKQLGSFIKPRGSCVDRQGNIIVADKGNHRIQRFSANGKFDQVLLDKDDGLESPVDVTYTHSGNLIVITEKGMVYILNNDMVT